MYIDQVGTNTSRALMSSVEEPGRNPDRIVEINVEGMTGMKESNIHMFKQEMIVNSTGVTPINSISLTLTTNRDGNLDVSSISPSGGNRI